MATVPQYFLPLRHVLLHHPLLLWQLQLKLATSKEPTTTQQSTEETAEEPTTAEQSIDEKELTTTDVYDGTTSADENEPVTEGSSTNTDETTSDNLVDTQGGFSQPLLIGTVIAAIVLALGVLISLAIIVSVLICKKEVRVSMSNKPARHLETQSNFKV